MYAVVGNDVCDEVWKGILDDSVVQQGYIGRCGAQVWRNCGKSGW